MRLPLTRLLGLLSLALVDVETEVDVDGRVLHAAVFDDNCGDSSTHARFTERTLAGRFKPFSDQLIDPGRALRELKSSPEDGTVRYVAVPPWVRVVAA